MACRETKFCEKESISIRNFVKWRRKVKANLNEDISEARPKDISNNQIKFLPVKINEANGSEGNNLKFPDIAARVELNQLTFYVYNGADCKTLKGLFLALEDCL